MMRENGGGAIVNTASINAFAAGPFAGYLLDYQGGGGQYDEGLCQGMWSPWVFA